MYHREKLSLPHIETLCHSLPMGVTHYWSKWDNIFSLLWSFLPISRCTTDEMLLESTGSQNHITIDGASNPHLSGPVRESPWNINPSHEVQILCCTSWESVLGFLTSDSENRCLRRAAGVSIFVESIWAYLGICFYVWESFPELGVWLLWCVFGVMPCSHLCCTAQQAGDSGDGKCGGTTRFYVCSHLSYNPGISLNIIVWG